MPAMSVPWEGPPANSLYICCDEKGVPYALCCYRDLLERVSETSAPRSDAELDALCRLFGAAPLTTCLPSS